MQTKNTNNHQTINKNITGTILVPEPNNSQNINFKYNRLELVLLSGSEYDLMDYQPHKSKNLYLVSSTEFILYNIYPSEAQKMKLIENIVAGKTRVYEPESGDSAYFNDYCFDDCTLKGRDIVIFDFISINTGEEHMILPLLKSDDFGKIEQYGYLRDGTILNKIDTKKYMDILLEKERIRDLEHIATTAYIPPSSSTGMFIGFHMYSFANEHFGSLETIKEVESKYKELAKIYHPDRGGEELMFKAIANTKQYLIDEINYKNGT